MPRVVLIDEVGDVEASRAALAGHPQVTVQRADRLPEGDDVIGLLVGTEVPVGAPELARVPAVRIVAATATGYDHIDLAAVAAVGAWATHCPGYCDDEVAETAIAFAVDLLRGVTLLDRSVHIGRYDHLDAPGRRIAGSVLGIVGLGRIGRAVAWRAHALGMRVLAADPVLDAAAAAPAELVGLDELLAAADVVSLHALLTPETEALIGAERLALMRPDAYLINCARSALVDHEALGEALRAGRLGGCALDVLPQEPPAPDEPALRWPRTLINPHSAWYSPESSGAPYRMAAEAVAAVLEGREPAAVIAHPAA
ncbi:MAG TPA: NAD(P)-dependent oxidoreductase [Solirubrobacteraceae bacterium]|jgi:D-3-phosphoglycerate dehydrogenase|nr:NAD(P)-dependent oxidoreductase [Solirubrobacteraceae bacterium]